MLARNGSMHTARWLALLGGVVLITIVVFIRRDGTHEPAAAIALRAGPGVERATPTVELQQELSAAPAPTRVAPATNAVASEAHAPEALAPEGGVLRGVLVRPDRGSTGDGHTVVLIETDAGGAPRPEGGRVVVTPQADGRFELRLPEWSIGVPVLLVGRATDHLPAMLVLRPARGVPLGDVELLLEEGAVLRGRIVHGGDPVADWPVELDLRFGVPGVFDAGEEGFWLDGRFVEKLARTRTGARGEFEFKGLAPDRYDLRCPRMPPSVPSDHTEVVQIDGAEHTIELADAELAVVVTGPGGVIRGADVRVACERGGVEFRSTRAPVVVGVPAHTEVTLHVEHVSHANGAMTLMSGARGERIEVVLALEPVVRPALRVWLPGATDARLGALSLDLLALDDSARERRLELGRGTAVDEFWLPVLPAPPGGYALRLRSVGAFQSEVIELEVPERGVVEVTFQGERGGRFAVDLGSELAQWSATWRIRAMDGREVVPPRNRNVGGDGEEFEFTMTDLSETGPQTLVPDVEVLPPGRYILEVESEQHVDCSLEFDVVTGETARLVVRLRPK